MHLCVPFSEGSEGRTRTATWTEEEEDEEDEDWDSASWSLWLVVVLVLALVVMVVSATEEAVVLLDDLWLLVLLLELKLFHELFRRCDRWAFEFVGVE